MIMSPTACLRRKWISSLVRWEEEAGRGGGQETQGDEFLCPWSEEEDEDEDEEQEGWNCVGLVFP